MNKPPDESCSCHLTDKSSEVHYKELEFKLQAQEELKEEHFERDKPRDDFNINNKSHVLHSLVEGSKFPKEWNREHFLQGSREILQGVGVSAGDEGDSKYTYFSP